ncbi:MAG: glycosyltransferase family 1 protein [Cyclobacteriaceae bacterium]|nr:glycosyltransferase family 1 protein [Cyclobacteriaceae bacterium]
MNRFEKPFPQRQLTIIYPQMILPINWLSRGKLYDYLANINDWIIARSIKAAIRKFKISEFVYINSYNPLCFQKFPKFFKPLRYIYQTVDNIEESKYVNKHGGYLERRAVEEADYTLVTSSELLRKIQKVSANAYLIPNAAEIQVFQKSVSSPAEKPKEIAHVHNRIIGYVGNLDFRLDYRLIKNIALNHPEKILLLVGPVNTDEINIMGIDVLENVLMTGSKKYSELPVYIKYMDCTIIPFKCNELTKSIYPLKINEYLACGKPVVSTPFSEDIQGFASIIYLSENDRNFIESIDHAIATDTEIKTKERMEFASQNNWQNRIDLFWEIYHSNTRFYGRR